MAWERLLQIAVRFHESWWPISYPAIAVGAWFGGRIAVIGLTLVAVGLCAVVLLSGSAASGAASGIAVASAIVAWGALWTWASRLRQTSPVAAPTHSLLSADQSEELAEVLRLARVGSWRWEITADRVYWSETLYEIFGLDPSEPPPSYARHMEIYSAESFRRLDAAVRAAASQGRPYMLDLEIRHSSGASGWITGRGEAIRDRSGNIVALRGTVIDITERRNMLDALSRSESELAMRLDEIEQIYRYTPVGLFAFDRDFRYLRVNERMAEINGVPSAAHLGKTMWDIVPDIAPIVAGIAQPVLENGESLLDQEVHGHTAKNPDRGRDWLVNYFPLRSPAGGIIGMFGAVLDITERKRVERALQESEARFRAIFNSTFQFIGLLTPDGTLVEANETAVAFTGLPAEQLIGRPFWESYWWTGSTETQDRLRAAIVRAAQGEFVRYDEDLQGASGTRITIDFSLKPVRNEAGEIVLLIPEGRDVSEDRLTRQALAESEQRFRLAMQTAPIGEALVATDGRFISVNESLCKMLGYPEADLLARSFQDLTHPDDLAADLAYVNELLAGVRNRYRMNKRYFRADGETIDVQLDVSLLRDADGQPIHFISQIQDITEHRRLEAQREALTQRLQLALGVSGIGVWEWELSSGRLTWDQAIHRMYGVPASDQPDYTTWQNAVLAEDLPRTEAMLADAIRDKANGSIEFRINHPRFGVRFLESAFGPVLDERRNVLRLVGVSFDITERMEAERRISQANRQLEQRITEVYQLQEQLREQAIRDGLTGLFNRRHFDERLAAEIERGKREGQGISLVMADLDHFKALNDRHGHQGGDRLLCAWSDLLRSSFRATDVLCRYGGEEFALVLPGSSLEDATARAEYLRVRLKELVISTEGAHPISTTVSLGVAFAAAGEKTSEQLIREADAALYRAKSEGRNRVATALSE